MKQQPRTAPSYPSKRPTSFFLPVFAVLFLFVFSCNLTLNPETQNPLDNLPTIEAIADTMISFNNMLEILVQAKSPNGEIQMYYWSVDSARTWEVSNSSNISLSWTDADTGEKKIFIKVVDNAQYESIPVSFKAVVTAPAPQWPAWDGELVYDDFNNVYGDHIARNYTGSIMSYVTSGTYSDGDWGWWYVYQGGVAEVQNPSGIQITGQNISSAFNADYGYLHIKFAITKAADYCAIASNILDEGDWCDFTNLTSVSLRAKGYGWIRMYLRSRYVEDRYDWGHLGYVIHLTANWKDIVIPVNKMIPAKWSDVEEDNITWDMVKTGIGSFAIEANPDENGDKDTAEVFIDDIVFNGMRYSDIISPAQSQ